MISILLSLLLIGLCAFLCIISLNYSVYLWENKRVSNLASKIKAKHGYDILEKSNVSRSFTSLDLNSSLQRSRMAQVASSMYDRTIVSLTNKEYPDWFTNVITELENFRKNAWLSTKRFVRYLISLTKPVQKENLQPFTQEDLEKEKKQADIVELVDRVSEGKLEIDPSEENLVDVLAHPIFNSDPADGKSDYTNNFSSGTSKATSSSSGTNSNANSHASSASSNSNSSGGGLATLSMASAGSDKDEKDMSVFEKTESRLLDKLKDSGLHNYDVWLELGRFYIKYEEPDKAKEVFSLVAKHSSGKEKEEAVNQLIAIG